MSNIRIWGTHIQTTFNIHLSIDQSAICFHSTFVGVASNGITSTMAEKVIMETAVENAVNIFTVNIL